MEHVLIVLLLIMVFNAAVQLDFWVMPYKHAHNHCNVAILIVNVMNWVYFVQHHVRQMLNVHVVKNVRLESVELNVTQEHVQLVNCVNVVLV